jgi:hypothetical protein
MLPQERPKESGGRRTSFGASQAETENSPVIRGRFHFSAVQALLLERAEELQAQCARIWSVMRCAERAAPEYYRLGTGLLRTSWRPPARGRNRRAVIGPPRPLFIRLPTARPPPRLRAKLSPSDANSHALLSQQGLNHAASMRSSRSREDGSSFRLGQNVRCGSWLCEEAAARKIDRTTVSSDRD